MQIQPLSSTTTSLTFALVIAGLTALAYTGIQFNGYHFDDWPNILNNAFVRIEALSPSALLDAARHTYLPRRPVASVSFALDWWRGGGAPGPFLITNLIIHLLTTWAVFAFLLRTLTPGRTATILICALATLWWAAQPIHVQAVSYIVQRMTELAALFSILAVWAWIRARSAPAHPLPWFIASAAAFLLGALSKENAWITPGLILMAELLVLRHQQPMLRTSLDRLLVAIPFIGAAAVIADLAVEGPISRFALPGYHIRDFNLVERLLTQPKVVLFHVSQILWPAPGRFSLEHDVAIVRSAADWHFWLPMSIITAWTAAGAALAARPAFRLHGFFMLWVPATLLIESSIVPLELIFEHRMYLPAVGLAGLIALVISHAHQHHRILAHALVALVAAHTLLALWATHQRVPHWRTEATLLEHATLHAPNSVRIWNQLGVEYLRERRLEEAERAIQRANEIDPRWGDGYPFVNLGVLMEARGNTDAAFNIYTDTIRLFPRQVLGHNNRGLIYLRAGQFNQALHDFDAALKADPDYAPAWTNRGTARYLRGELQSARADFERAITLSPHESLALYYLARLHNAEGRATEAARFAALACRGGIQQACTQ